MMYQLCACEGLPEGIREGHCEFLKGFAMGFMKGAMCYIRGAPGEEQESSVDLSTSTEPDRPQPLCSF